MGHAVALFINTPELVEEFMVTKNKFYDKHPMSSLVFKKVMGDSILWTKSDMKWAQKRKVVSTSLYKDRLRDMLEQMKTVTIKSLREEWMNKPNNTIDIVSETSKLFMNILLECLFSTNDTFIEQTIGGVTKRMHLGEAM